MKTLQKYCIIILLIPSLWLSCLKDNLDTGKITGRVVLLDSSGKPLNDYSKVKISMVGKVQLNRKRKLTDKEEQATCDSAGVFQFSNIRNNTSYQVTIELEGFGTRQKAMVSAETPGKADSITLKQDRYSQLRNIRIRLTDASGGIISSGHLYLFDNESFCSIDNISKATYPFEVRSEELEIRNIAARNYWAIGTYTDGDGNFYFSNNKFLAVAKDYADVIAVGNLKDDKQNLIVSCKLNNIPVHIAAVYLFTAGSFILPADTVNNFTSAYTDLSGKAIFPNLPKNLGIQVLGSMYGNNLFYSGTASVTIGAPGNKNTLSIDLSSDAFKNQRLDFTAEFKNMPGQPVAGCQVYLYRNLKIRNEDITYSQSERIEQTYLDGTGSFKNLPAGTYYIKAKYKLGNDLYTYISNPIILDSTPLNVQILLE